MENYNQLHNAYKNLMEVADQMEKNPATKVLRPTLSPTLCSLRDQAHEEAVRLFDAGIFVSCEFCSSWVKNAKGVYEVKEYKPVVGKRDILSTDNMCLCENCLGDEEEEEEEQEREAKAKAKEAVDRWEAKAKEAVDRWEAREEEDKKEKKEARNKRRRELYQLKKMKGKFCDRCEEFPAEVVGWNWCEECVFQHGCDSLDCEDECVCPPRKEKCVRKQKTAQA
jgi:hypothetical protein